MNFLTIVIFLFTLIISILLGILAAYLLMRPNQRRFFHNHKVALLFTYLLIGLALFTLVFGTTTYYKATAFYRVVSNRFAEVLPAVEAGSDLPRQGEAWTNNKTAIIKEAWLQQLKTPRNGIHCYSQNETVCELMQGIGLPVYSTWGIYLSLVVFGISSVIAFLLYSNWILITNYDDDTSIKVKPKRKPKSKARK
ncbi:MAG TPA: hypothetical protein VJZ78_00185 [Anaerolineales bacterium]|nr:hypothetical protein [Anaerolineales bacterium]